MVILYLRWRLRLSVFNQFCLDISNVSIACGILPGRLRLGIIAFRVPNLNDIWSLRLSVRVVRELCLINLEKIDYFLMSFHLSRKLMVIRDPLELFDFSENALLHLGGKIADFLVIDGEFEQRI